MAWASPMCARCANGRSKSRLDDAALPAIAETLASLADDATAELAAQGIAPAAIEIIRRVHVKVEGTDTALVVEHGTLAEIAERFAAAHRQRYGFDVPDKAKIVEAASVEAVGHTEKAGDAELAVEPGGAPPAGARSRRHAHGRARHAGARVRARATSRRAPPSTVRRS